MLEIKDLHASVAGKEILRGINLQVKGATGALVYPSAPPGTAFVISEQTLTASIYEYLRRTIKTSDRAETIRRLGEYIKALTA